MTYITETTELYLWIAEKIIFLVLVPISFYIMGRIDGYRKRSKEYETDFDFEKENDL